MLNGNTPFILRETFNAQRLLHVSDSQPSSVYSLTLPIYTKCTRKSNRLLPSFTLGKSLSILFTPSSCMVNCTVIHYIQCNPLNSTLSTSFYTFSRLSTNLCLNRTCYQPPPRAPPTIELSGTPCMQQLANVFIDQCFFTPTQNNRDR